MSIEWDAAASVRRNQIESGKDLTFSKVFVPEFESIIRVLKPSSILEAGSGTGHLAFELSKLTKRYVGVEPSTGMMAEANELLRNATVELVHSTLQSYQTSESFDLVISHMCLQAIGDYTAFLRAIEGRLATGGGFLISIPHPAFFNDYKKVIQLQEFHYMRDKSALINFQITLDSQGTIEQVPYFHRSLTNYISALVNAGLNLSFFKEIFPTAETRRFTANLGLRLDTYCLAGAQQKIMTDHQRAVPLLSV
jgi:SAM-dependent methyltransferase